MVPYSICTPCSQSISNRWWFRQGIRSIRRHNVSQVSFYFLLLCICWTLHGTLDDVIGGRLLLVTLDIITAWMGLREGWVWMNYFDGGMMDTLCGMRWVGWFGLPLSFSVIINSLLDKSFLPLSLRSSNHRRLPSIGLFLPSRSNHWSKWNDFKIRSVDWLNDKRLAEASDN